MRLLFKLRLLVQVCADEFVMALVLDLLFSKALSSEELLEWLTDPEYKASIPELQSLDSERRKDFVRVFVDFIRDQCPFIQQTPSPAKVRRPTSPSTRVTNCDSVRALKHDSVVCTKSRPAAVHRRQTTVRVSGDCNKPLALLTTAAQPDSSCVATGIPCSQLPAPCLNHKRLISRGEQIQPAVYASQNAPDIADCTIFPAVNTVIKHTRPIRRITPTPVKSHWRKLTLNDFLPPEVSHESQRKDSHRLLRPPHKEFPKSQSKKTDALQLRLSSASQSCSSVQCCSGKFQPTPECHDIGTPAQSTGELQTENWVVPTPNHITEREKLDALATVYAAFLNEGLVVNLTIELFFLLQLLTVKQKVNVDEKSPTKLLHSVHNCSHFAASVLQNILQWLCFLDKPTLKLLSNVDQLSAFAPQLYSSLVKLVEGVEPVSRGWSSSIQGVAFDDSTDSQNHFACDNNFRAFRKQRDLFYSLFRDWQRHQFGSGKSFGTQFTKRVAEILDMCNNPCNLSHLARLVLGQLMTSCCGGLEFDDQGNLDEKFLYDLRSTSPGKMQKLEERFLLPFKVGGPCPNPSFTGSQVFFYEFIRAATSSIFLQHFKDQCVARIVEFEKDNPFQNAEQVSSDDVRRALIAAVYKFKLLGLFLGVVEFLPYSTTESLPRQYQDGQQAIRNHKPLPLNITGLIRESVQSKQLAATLTWVVNFLSMMDPIARTLTAYKDVLGLLFSIYKSAALLQASSAAFFARVLLGWLFEVQSIQSDVLAHASGGVLTHVESLGSFVDGSIIYMCCPYLRELRCVLLEHIAGRKAKYGEIRKITPISAGEGDLKVQLANQLEENFFHIHPLSVRKTVEFVADRVSSNVAKCLKKEVQDTIACSGDIILQVNLEARDENEETENIAKLFQQISEKTEKAALEKCKGSVQKLLPALLPPDMEDQAVRMCCSLSTRSAVSKVQQWIKANVTERALRQGMSTTPCAAILGQSCKEKSNIRHYTVTSASTMLNSLQDHMQRLQSGEGCTTEKAIDLLELCVKSVGLRLEWSPTAASTLQQASFDFVLCLAVWCPDVCTRDVFYAAVPLWENSPAVKKACKKLYCARNLHLALMSVDTDGTMLKFGQLAQVLLHFGFITVEDLERSLSHVLDFELPGVVLEAAVCVISSVLKLCKNSDSCSLGRPD